ncbi:MAG: FecR domain-containing protein [Planctomycetota bacterium]
MNDRELIDAYLHDRLPAASRSALLARLADEPELRRALREGLEMEAFLADLHQATSRCALPLRRWRWRRGPIATATAAAAVLVAAALLWMFTEQAVSTRVFAVSGKVTVMRATGELADVQTGMHLDAGDRIRTGSDAALRIQRGERVICSVGSSAELTLSEREHADLVVRTGRLDVEVEPPSSFVLATPRGTVRVLGTRFSVDVQPDRDLIRVSRGRVHIASEADKSSDTHILDAGHHLVLTDTGDGVPRETVDDDLQPWLHYDFDATYGRAVRASGDAGPASDLLAGGGPPLEASGGAVRVASEHQLRTQGTLPRLREFLDPASAWSVSLWVEQPALTAQDRNLVLLVLATPDPTEEDHHIHLAISLGTQVLAEGSAGTLRHLVAVHEQGSTRIFIDGIEGEPRRSGRQPIDEHAPLFLSPTPVLLDADNVGRPTAVRYHDLALYGRALNSAEVRRLHRAGPDGLDRPRR